VCSSDLPCIWPVLPIVLSATSSGPGKRRPLGIVLGVTTSFAVITLSISTLVKIFHLDPNILRTISVVVVIFLGILMIFPDLYSKFENLTAGFGNRFRGSTNAIVTGLALGVLWTPCAGPILATISALAATGKINLDAVLVTIVYVAGVGVPLLGFALAGQRILLKLKGISKFTGKIQSAFGAVMILAAAAIYTNFDQTLQLQLLTRFPVLGTVVNGFENSSLVTNQLSILKGQQPNPVREAAGLFNTHVPAPDFTGITKWLNTYKPLSINDLKGKVVLVDFWTYTCINCIRTLPQVTAWYDKYKDQGFTVIGVHTPEFQFEHDTQNVINAIKMYNIKYPVAQDNKYATWNNYNNQYWPAEYLIDTSGNIRRVHFGEGEYDQTELAIQTLLKEAGNNINTSMTKLPNQTPTGVISPETYLGTARMQYYFPSGSVANGTQTYYLSDNLHPNSFSFGGIWTITNEYAQAVSNATMNYNFKASKVYIILRPGSVNPGKVKVFLDGNADGEITVNTDRLYTVVDLGDKTESHIIKLEFETAGIQAFTFTFG
jgi:cytochrome c biogenesis protein CcdA/thiol-disulfide isomerase/thioredoxin